MQGVCNGLVRPERKALLKQDIAAVKFRFDTVDRDADLGLAVRYGPTEWGESAVGG